LSAALSVELNSRITLAEIENDLSDFGCSHNQAATSLSMMLNGRPRRKCGSSGIRAATLSACSMSFMLQVRSVQAM
jgi:hypothetical protein